MSDPAHSPLLVVLSGPSGVGKDAVLTRMRELDRPYHFTVTATTRKRRRGEVDGVDYIFVTRSKFRRMLDAGELLEHAQVYGNLNGVPREQVANAMSAGRDVMVKVDVQGAATIRRLVPDALLIFLAAPSIGELEGRLRRRMTESPDALKVRLETARAEIAKAPGFDYIVFNRNDRIDDAVRDIDSVVERERRLKAAGQVRAL